MRKTKEIHLGLFVGLAGLVSSGSALASDATGELFYTRFQGAPNVWKVPFNYNDAANTASLGAPVPLATAPGADGIIFSPSGNLLIGGQGQNKVFEYRTDGTQVSQGNALGNSFHLALDPSGTKVWTSGFGADLADLPLTPNVGNATPPLHNVTGDDGGVTQLAFTPSGKAFYVNGQPNGHGNVGTIDMATFETDRFASNVEPAHGMVYDSFTGLMTLFGDGKAGTFDPASVTPESTLVLSDELWTDFDQGAVDGKGHALVAGGGAITFIDYSTSGSITAPDFVQVFTGFDSIDDVAPLSGLGSGPTPAPDGGSTLALLLIGAGALSIRGRARR